MVEVQSLRNHLCADKDFILFLWKIFDNLLISTAGTSRIQIHTRYRYIREMLSNILLYPFRPETHHPDRRLSASRTHFRYLIRKTAVMASQLIKTLMISKTHIAMLALGNPCTLFTFHHRCESPPILKQNNLLVPVQSNLHAIEQFRCKIPSHTVLFPHLPHIYRDNFG